MPARRGVRQLLARVSRMSAHEVGVRVAQEVNKRLDATRARLGFSPLKQALARGPRTPGRFFFDPADVPALVECLRARLPEEAARIVRDAEQICARRFDLLGYRALDFGREIDWHLDPVNGRRAPRAPWFRVPFLDFNAVGDHKIIWELNRHQHLTTLARAFLLTNENRYLDELQAQWHAWQSANPYPYGINWASSLEVAFRCLSWIWIDHLLGGRAAMAPAIAQHARYVEKYLSTYFAPNTHLLGEAVALYFAGTLYPQFAAASRWRRRGWEIIENEAARQVLPDGMHFEQSTYYHVYALDMFLHARLLAARNGESIPAELDAVIERMADALHAQSQAGAAPRFGDDDGGRLFDPRRNRTEHMLDPLATAAALYRRPDFKAAAGGTLREESLWLLGLEGMEEFDRLPAAPHPPASTRCAASGAYCLVATEPVVREVIVDAGPHGYGSGGHGHADALSLQWITQGQHWLIDPGAFCYPLPLGRNRFRGTAAHNTLEIDGLDQAEPAASFNWRTRPETRIERWLTSPLVDVFTASHDGYARLPDPVIHRRWVVSWKTGLLFVRDVTIGRAVHDLAIHWHLGPEFQPVRERPSTFAAPDGAAITFVQPSDPAWTCEIAEGEWSPAYGAKAPAPVLRYRARTTLPAEFAVALAPGASENAALERLPGKPLAIYRYADGTDALLILFHDGAGSWEWEGWESDAAILCFGRHAGKPWLFAPESARLQFQGRDVTTPTPPESALAVLD
jgi:hypothetical protein